MSYIDEFIASIENKSTVRVTNKYLKNAPDGFEFFSPSELSIYILSLRPKAKHDISNICSRIKSYAKWLDERALVKNNTLLQSVQTISKEELWEQAKLDAEAKFISHAEYRSVISSIQMSEEYNPLYYEVLFRSIYEGIYSDDLSALENLRKCDIEGNVVSICEENGKPHRMKVSDTLARQLQELSAINMWIRPNLHGICEVGMSGLFTDSVFKEEGRQDRIPQALRYSYYKKLREIREKYIGHTLSPKNLYISGVMHRIKKLLEMNDISLQQAFSDNSQIDSVRTIIANELMRCNGVMQLDNFIQHVKEHLDIFVNDSTEDISNDLFDDISVREQSEVFFEGEEYLSTHVAHERNTEVVELAKARFKLKNDGRLFCEKCGFDFSRKYGVRGSDFIEAHHTKAISQRIKNEPTRIEDLVMLCSNCHRIVHLTKPWLTMDELEDIIKP